ncbi:hypothetical protein DID88_007364 [Monilinia fructigena]|uniref:Uncharacterized protein n=1 Tax=Monilinia fructigena TaxID=38457 RepID=A0A395J813_9HELO|nr:hypothetical protein DID88_007364 [Monilinia fructigena]
MRGLQPASAKQSTISTLPSPNPTQTFTEPPFRCENEGWGDIAHDLNFAKTRYEAKHPITFKNPSRELINALRETGPVPGDENGAISRKKDADGKKRKRTGQIDMEKLAEGLIKLQEDDLLHVVQMIHDNKSEDTYTKNDIDQGEFHVDLYTLPESLLGEMRGLIDIEEPSHSIHSREKTNIGIDIELWMVDAYMHIWMQCLKSLFTQIYASKGRSSLFVLMLIIHKSKFHGVPFFAGGRARKGGRISQLYLAHLAEPLCCVACFWPKSIWEAAL